MCSKTFEGWNVIDYLLFNIIINPIKSLITVQPHQIGSRVAGVAAAGISREQQAKMLQQQQQQMLRAQHQMRPPPPEYKARFAAVGGGLAGLGARRPAVPQAAPAPRPFAQHARQYSPEWRHVLMQQQATRQQFPHHHQGN